MNFVIESLGEIKEAFTYERPLNAHSQHALLEYARATYGPTAFVREMTVDEQSAHTKDLLVEK